MSAQPTPTIELRPSSSAGHPEPSSTRNVTSSPLAKNQRFYRPELDALRFFAFLGVFIFHVVPHEPSVYTQHHFFPEALVGPICAFSGAGAFGVDLFFALSAYLITVLLFRERNLRGYVDVKAFYIRRILRIWPLYFFFIALAAIVPLWDHLQRLEWPYVAGFLLLAGNWVYAWKGLPDSIIVIPLWSISVEEQFYLLWPLIARKASLAQMKYVLAGLLSLGYLSRIFLVWKHATGAAAEYNTFARIDPIVLGILVAVIFGERSVKLSLVGRLSLILACLATWVAIAPYAALNEPRALAPVMGTLLGRPVISLAAIGILVGFIGAPTAGARILGHPVLTYLGRISYGLYVYHMAGLMIAKHVFAADSARGHLLRAALGFLSTLILSAASYHWLESPFLRWKDRFATILTRPV
jgi:peptidoglycan/LPS O-acetylase OafA/YrhL